MSVWERLTGFYSFFFFFLIIDTFKQLINSEQTPQAIYRLIFPHRQMSNLKGKLTECKSKDGFFFSFLCIAMRPSAKRTQRSRACVHTQPSLLEIDPLFLKRKKREKKILFVRSTTSKTWRENFCYEWGSDAKNVICKWHRTVAGKGGLYVL